MPKVTVMNGAIFSVAKTYAAAVDMTALTNAAEAVATLEADHGLVVGDIVEVSSGWGEIDQMLVRVKAVAVNDVTFEGGVLGSTDTTDTTRFPVGAGTGTVRKVTEWQNIDNIKEPSISGGEMQTTDTTVLTDKRQKNAPTIASAIEAKLTIQDDPTMPWYATVKKASDTGAITGVRITFKNKSILLVSAYLGFVAAPQGSMNSTLTTQLSINYQSEIVRYTA